MLFEFSGDNWLGIHLGMTGKIHVERPDFRRAKHDHLVLIQRDRVLVFTDPRQLGHVQFHHGKDAPDWWKDRPPEIDSAAFDHGLADANKSARRATEYAFGVQWHFAPAIKLVANYAHTRFDGGQKGGDRDAETVIISRFQVAY